MARFFPRRTMTLHSEFQIYTRLYHLGLWSSMRMDIRSHFIKPSAENPVAESRRSEYLGSQPVKLTPFRKKSPYPTYQWTGLWETFQAPHAPRKGPVPGGAGAVCLLLEDKRTCMSRPYKTLSIGEIVEPVGEPSRRVHHHTMPNNSRLYGLSFETETPSNSTYLRLIQPQSALLGVLAVNSFVPPQSFIEPSQYSPLPAIQFPSPGCKPN